MRAIAVTEFGGPDALHVVERPVPEPQDGEVLVRVHAATVNPADTLLRSGAQAARLTGLEPPYVPGMELSGHVEAVGSGVTRVRVGQPVMAVVDPIRPAGGAQAQLVAVPEASVVPLSAGADLVAFATVPMNGLTAVEAIELLDLAQGDSLLVTGGAGALGGYIIELAVRAGLVVVADAAPADVDFLRALGTQHVVPRGEGMADAVRSLFPDGVDGIVDAARIGAAATALVRDGGAMVSARAADPPDPRLRHSSVWFVHKLTDTASLEHLVALAESGGLHLRVGRTLPLDQAAEAHRLVEAGGQRGRVVLLLED